MSAARAGEFGISDAESAAVAENARVPLGPAHMTAPQHMPQLQTRYEQLRELFPEWQGLDHRMSQGGSFGSPRTNAQVAMLQRMEQRWEHDDIVLENFSNEFRRKRCWVYREGIEKTINLVRMFGVNRVLWGLVLYSVFRRTLCSWHYCITTHTQA